MKFTDKTLIIVRNATLVLGSALLIFAAIKLAVEIFNTL